MPTVPTYNDDEVFEPDPWMHLVEVVQWVARLNGFIAPPTTFGIKRVPRPKRGDGRRRTVCELVQYSWVDFGDGDHAELKKASAIVRAALAESKITAWLKDGQKPLSPVNAADWSSKIDKADRLAVPWHHIAGLTETILVSREAMMDLWPAPVERELGRIRKEATNRGEPLTRTIGKLCSPDDDFDWNAEVAIRPWWGVSETIAWIATKSVSFAKLMGARTRDRDESFEKVSAHGTILYCVSERFCGCGLPVVGDELEKWERCVCVRNAGHQLLAKIASGEVSAFDDVEKRQLGLTSFVRIGNDNTAWDWWEIKPEPVFQSSQIRAIFHALMACLPVAGAGHEQVGGPDAGRPNKRTEALQLHTERVRDGQSLTNRTQEAAALHSILVLRHASNPLWNYKLASVERALREHNAAEKKCV